MNNSRTPYDPGYFQALFKAEDNHFWFCGRNRIIYAVAGQITQHLPDGFRAIEVGCGTGNVLRVLEHICSRGHLIGLDLYYQGLSLARPRVSCDLILGDIRTPPFGSGFSLIALFDVIEHLQNDTDILMDVHQALDVDGWVIITVPALPGLWSYFDEAAHHVRRYTKKMLTDVIQDAGFELQFLSYTMMSILPFVWLNRMLAGQKEQEKTPDVDRDSRVYQELRIIPIINGVFSAILGLESQIIRAHFQLPIGSSLIAVAQKKNN